jgi:HEAT repeat protein
MPSAQTLSLAPALLLCCAASLAALASCGSTSARGERDPTLEERFRKEEADRLREQDMEANLQNQLIKFDQVLERYTKCIQNSGNQRAEEEAERFAAYLTDNTDRWLDLLLRELETSPNTQNRFVAAGVLGFARSKRVMNPLLNALHDADPAVRGNAALSLGIRADPDTPIEPLVRLVEDVDCTEACRTNASFALYKLQEAGIKPEVLQPHWLRFLSGEPDSVEPGIAIHSLRGLGLLRDPKTLDALVPYTSHRAAKVRAAAAVALGRTNDRQAAPALIALLGPAEANPTVRLCARKALQALAGGVDRKDDVAEWKKVFGLP